MEQKFYPNEEWREGIIESKKNDKKMSYKNSRDVTITVVILAVLSLIGTVWQICIFNKDIIPTTVLTGGLFIILSFVLVFTIRWYLEEKKSVDVQLPVRVNEVVVLYDEHLEYLYTEDGVDYIGSVRYDAIIKQEYSEYDLWLYCRNDNDILWKSNKASFCAAEYEVDNTVTKTNTFAIPHYIDGDGDLSDAIWAKQHHK
jgi:hypothetical protein